MKKLMIALVIGLMLGFLILAKKEAQSAIVSVVTETNVVTVTNIVSSSDKLPTTPEEFLKFGFSKEIATDIAVGAVRREYAAKMRELKAKLNPPYYTWEPWIGKARIEGELRKLQREQDAEIARRLGGKFDSEDYGEPRNTDYDFLDESKREKVREIREDSKTLQRRTTELAHEGGNAEASKINVQELDSVFALLTPQEQLEYMRRFSTMSVRQAINLSPINPTEEEYKAYQNYCSDCANDPHGAGEKLRNTLGEERYADFMAMDDINTKKLRYACEMNGVSQDQALAAARFFARNLDEKVPVDYSEEIRNTIGDEAFRTFKSMK